MAVMFRASVRDAELCSLGNRLRSAGMIEQSAGLPVDDTMRPLRRGNIMQFIVRLAAMLVVTSAFADAAPAFARGGAANIMDSPGYQRRLQESRQQVSQPSVQMPVAQPRKTGRRRRHRH